MVAEHGHHEEAFLDAQDITDFPIFNTSRKLQTDRAKKDSNKSLVKEELRLLRGIKKAVEINAENKKDRRKEKKFSDKKDQTESKILEDLNELLKYIKKHPVISLGPSLPSIFNKGRNAKDRITDYFGGGGKASKAEAAEEAAPKKKGFFKGKGGRILKSGIKVAGVAGAGFAAKDLYDSYQNSTANSGNGKKKRGNILRSALDGATLGAEAGSVFDGIGAIPGAAIGAIGAGAAEAYSEYKDDITKEFNNLTKTTMEAAVSDTKYLLNATEKQIEKYLPSTRSFSIDGIEKSISEYKDKAEDAIISFWKRGESFFEDHKQDIDTIKKDASQGAYRALDRAENKVGIHAAWEPDAVSALNSITTGNNPLNRDFAIAVAQSESGGGKLRGNKTSSAKGMYQFLDGTAAEVAKKHHIDMSDPNSSETSAELFKAYTEDNRNLLKKNLNRDPTDPELYMAHFLGGGGASTMLQAWQSNPNAIAASINQSAAKSNHNMFYGKDGHAYTTKEFYDHFTQRYNQKLKEGKESLAIQEKRFGMNDAGTKEDLTASAEKVAQPIKDAFGRVVHDISDQLNALDKQESQSKAVNSNGSDDEDITVSAKRRNKNVQPTWLEKNMPATANNWDSLKDIGKSLSGIVSGSQIGTTDLSGGDRTFVNRGAYNQALDSNVAWLDGGQASAGGAYSRDANGNIDTSGLLRPEDGLDTKASYKYMMNRAKEIKDQNAADATTRAKAIEDTTPDFGLTKEQTYEQNQDRKYIRQRVADIKKENAASAGSNSQDLNSSKIDMDDIPMFLQDNGVIIINSGRGT